MGKQQSERDKDYEEKRIVHPEDVRRCAAYIIRYVCKEELHFREIESFFLLVAPNLGLSWPIDDKYRETLAKEGYPFRPRELSSAPCPLCAQSLSFEQFLAKVEQSKTQCNTQNKRDPALRRREF